MEDEELVKNISEPVQKQKIENIAGNEETVKNNTNIDEKEPFETNTKTFVNEELVKNISEPVQTQKIENIGRNEKELFETNFKTVVNEELVKNISGPVQTQKTKPVQPTKNIDEKERSETKIKTVVIENGEKESKNVSSISDFDAKLELKLSHLLEKNENQTLAKINEILEKNVSLSTDFNEVKVHNKKQVREKKRK